MQLVSVSSSLYILNAEELTKIVTSRSRNLQIQRSNRHLPNLPPRRHFRRILLLSLAALCAKIRFPRFPLLSVFLFHPRTSLIKYGESNVDGAVAILEAGVILLAVLLNPAYRRREIEKALQMERSAESTARSSFDDELPFETAGEDEESLLRPSRREGGRKDLERGGSARRIDVESALLE